MSINKSRTPLATATRRGRVGRLDTPTGNVAVGTLSRPRLRSVGADRFSSGPATFSLDESRDERERSGRRSSAQLPVTRRITDPRSGGGARVGVTRVTQAGRRRYSQSFARPPYPSPLCSVSAGGDSQSCNRYASIHFTSHPRS